MLGATVAGMLLLARDDVALGHRTPMPAQRFPLACRAAMRAAAGVLAVRARPAPLRSSPKQARDIWSVLEHAAPEWGEWAQYFSATTRSRIRRHAGVPAVTPREADDLLRNAEQFLFLVEKSLAGRNLPAAMRV